ncbi:MAG: MMPL family transporter, partial [Clostridia bacterium]|nr:MMPL family transporter [Clostridia bacterium]
MERFSFFVTKHKLAISIVFLVLTIVALICLFFVPINSDIISYLPDDMTTTEGYDFLKKTFNMNSDAIIAIKDATPEQMTEITQKMQELEGVRENGITWYGSLDSFANMGNIGGIDAGELVEQIKNNPDVIKLFRPKENIYTVMVQMSVASSTNEASVILKSSKKIIESYNLEYAVGGSAEISTNLLGTVVKEMPYFLIVAVVIVILILILTTKSFFEPVILLTTLAISILLNMGSNLILGNVSVITFATSAILQLALSMDYSIFLMHAFSEERRKCFDDRTAMIRAIPKTFSTVCASALTTIGGFIALMFMQFGIGADLGIVLAKGVLMSLLTVILLQPCLILFASKTTNKLAHPVHLPKFQKSAEASVKARKPILGVALIALVPIIFCGLSISYSYMKMDKNKAELTDVQQVVEVMGNSILICAPNVNGQTHLDFIEDVKKIDNVSVVSSIYALAPKEMADKLSLAIMIGLPQLKAYASIGYVLYTIMIETESESPEEGVLLKEVNGALKKYFDDDYYITGMAQAVNDLAVVTPKDFTLVSIVSAIIIFFILMFSVRSAKYSLALMGTVEFGIFINLALNFIMQVPVNFMAYIIISSVQMGATVDYAILLTMKFKRNMGTMPVKEACVKAIKDSSLSVLTSATILGALCLAVCAITTNAIIGQVTLLIGRGAIISAFLILFVLPAILIAITRKPPDNNDIF